MLQDCSMNIKLPLVFSGFMILSAMACSGSVGGGGGDGGSQGAGGSGGSGNTATSSTTSGSGGGTSVSGGSTSNSGGGIQCTGPTPMFPAFDKTCTVAADCVIKFHMVDCCGTRISIGINTSESTAFDQAEQICEAMYPGCGCAAMPTKAEDGKTALDESTIVVDCLSGACSTRVP
jgi:hypothetical protein